MRQSGLRIAEAEGLHVAGIGGHQVRSRAGNARSQAALVHKTCRCAPLRMPHERRRRNHGEIADLDAGGIVERQVCAVLVLTRVVNDPVRIRTGRFLAHQPVDIENAGIRNVETRAFGSVVADQARVADDCLRRAALHEMPDGATGRKCVFHGERITRAEIDVVNAPAAVAVVVEVATAQRERLSDSAAHDAVIAATDFAILEQHMAVHGDVRGGLAQPDGRVIAYAVVAPEATEDQAAKCGVAASRREKSGLIIKDAVSGPVRIEYRRRLAGLAFDDYRSEQSALIRRPTDETWPAPRMRAAVVHVVAGRTGTYDQAKAHLRDLVRRGVAIVPARNGIHEAACERERFKSLSGSDFEDFIIVQTQLVRSALAENSGRAQSRCNAECAKADESVSS